MRTIRFQSLPILMLCGLVAAISPSCVAQAGAMDSDATGTETYPQIVRISGVEGDVRIARGKLAEKDVDWTKGEATGWEQAEADLPLHSGYSLVTGKGRAEIEFEDASTVYLAENSVLTFSELTATAGVPYTEIALLAGTATIDIHTTIRGETFRLTTPTDNLEIRYPQRAVWRIDSYLDAVSITPQADPAEEQTGYRAEVVGKTTTYTDGEAVATPELVNTAQMAEWDAWAAQQVKARAAATAAAMKDAGLATPIPGLAEMNGQGHFFACAPYGTCWEPTHGWTGKATEVAAVTEKAAEREPAQAAAATGGEGAGTPATKGAKPSAVDVYLAAHPGAALSMEEYVFPCSSFNVEDVFGTDPVTGKAKLIDSYVGAESPGPWFYRASFGSSFGSPFYGGLGAGSRPLGRHAGSRLGLFATFDPWGDYAPYDWAICHAGSWVRWRRHYVWVAGTRRHHEYPVRWVKRGREVGFVPVHPRDVAGKQPLNLKDGMFKVTGKREQPIERLAFEPNKEYRVLSQPPREYLKPRLEALASAEVPEVEAHSALQTTVAVAVPVAAGDGKAGSGKVGGAFADGRITSSQTRGSLQGSGSDPAIRFDRKTQSFSIAWKENDGGKPSTVVELLGARNNVYQSNSFAGAVRPANTAGGYSGNGYSNHGASSYGAANHGASNNVYSNNGGGRTYAAAASGNNGSAARSYSAPAASYSGGAASSFSRSAPAPAASFSAPAPSAPSAAPSVSSPAHR